MKESKMNYPNPFDDSAIARQKRMGLLTPGGLPNKKAINVLAQVYAALFFDRLCDMNADMERCVLLCEELCDTLQRYDEHLMPLPAPIWWCLSNHNIILPYINEFVRYLSILINDFSAKSKK